MIKKIIPWVLIIGLLFQRNFSLANNVSSNNVSTMDIGLSFANHAKEWVSIESENAIVFGLSFGAHDFTPIVSIPPKEVIRVYKAGAYVYNAQGVPHLSTDEKDYNASVLGGYSVQIGGDYTHFEDAYQQVEQLLVKGIEAHVNISEAYTIHWGQFRTEADAQNFISTHSNRLEGTDLTVAQPNPSRLLVAALNRPLLSYDSSQADFAFKSSQVKYQGIHYRNQILLKRLAQSDITVINRLTMQEYLYGVVPREVSPSWHMEALKAQAVAARTYAIKNKGRFSQYGFDLCSTVSSQVYGGYDAEHSRTNRAVDETAGLVLYHQGELVNCFYHSDSGGFTEYASNVWSADLPYLKSVKEPAQTQSPHSKWVYRISLEELEELMNRAGHSVGPIQEVIIQKRTLGHRVHELKIVGSQGEKTFEKSEFRTLIGSSQLKSMMFGFTESWQSNELHGDSHFLSSTPEKTQKQELRSGRVELLPILALSSEAVHWFENADRQWIAVTSRGYERMIVEREGSNPVEGDLTYAVQEKASLNHGELVLYGSGFGHGVGMSQWGAKAMADSGHTFEQILKHYYVQTNISKYQ